MEPNHLTFSVEKTVYPPCEDSYLLAHALKIPRNAAVLDLGCGSGIQGITAIKGGASEIWFLDINQKALSCAKKNLEKNIGKKELKKIKTIFKKSDLFSKIPGKKTFDCIVFNPSYVPSETIQWNDTDGGKNGRETLDRFLKSAGKFLNPKGTVYFLQSSVNGIQKTESKLKKLGFEFEIVARQKLFFEELAVFRCRKK
ncbi:MAG: HemK2/MTQ2 family protein methyltransferase [Candidatus Micrarchaeota archaeon]